MSRFYLLKNAPKYTGFGASQDKRQAADIKITAQAKNNQINFYEKETRTGRGVKSQNLSLFGQKQNEMLSKQEQIPMVKEWFESLELSERVLCLTTVDAEIVSTLKKMQRELLKVGRQEQGKFRMSSKPENVSDGTKNGQDRFKIRHVFNLCNSQAHRSTQETVQAELEFLTYIRITDSLQMHDTLTVTEELVKEPTKFYNLAE